MPMFVAHVGRSAGASGSGSAWPSAGQRVDPRASVVALLGAESTGKTTLAAELGQSLDEAGLHAVRVGEYLREFCDRVGRVPSQAEQSGIAREQARRIDAARAIADIVIADTTALTIAVYSDLVYADRSLYAPALDDQRGYAITLLTALDLPWVADGLQRTGAHVQTPVDTLLRQALHEAGLAAPVISGRGPARLAAALAAVEPLLAELRPSGRAPPRR